MDIEQTLAGFGTLRFRADVTREGRAAVLALTSDRIVLLPVGRSLRTTIRQRRLTGLQVRQLDPTRRCIEFTDGESTIEFADAATAVAFDVALSEARSGAPAFVANPPPEDEDVPVQIRRTMAFLGYAAHLLGYLILLTGCAAAGNEMFRAPRQVRVLGVAYSRITVGIAVLALTLGVSSLLVGAALLLRLVARRWASPVDKRVAGT